MKKLAITTLALLLCCTCQVTQAQNNQGKMDDMGRIALAAIIPEQAENIPTAAQQRLVSLMQQVATLNGLGAASATPRFCMVPMVNIINKEITATAPPMHALTLEVVFLIVDAESQQIFSQTSFNIKGVGQSMDKAFMQAMNRIKPRAGQFKGFVEKGKEKIVQYYNSQCDLVLQTAKALAGQKKHEEAMYVLLSVPTVCRECYDKCLNMSIDIYQEFANNKCNECLAGAKAAYANMEIEKAAEYLSQISPDMECYEEANKLVDEITAKQKADGADIWNFKMKKYDDQIEKDKMRINAVKETAKSWAYLGAAKHFNWDWAWLYGKR